jgi:hypothetical protein
MSIVLFNEIRVSAGIECFSPVKYSICIGEKMPPIVKKCRLTMPEIVKNKLY